MFDAMDLDSSGIVVRSKVIRSYVTEVDKDLLSGLYDKAGSDEMQMIYEEFVEFSKLVAVQVARQNGELLE